MKVHMNKLNELSEKHEKECKQYKIDFYDKNHDNIINQYKNMLTENNSVKIGPFTSYVCKDVTF